MMVTRDGNIAIAESARQQGRPGGMPGAAADRLAPWQGERVEMARFAAVSPALDFRRKRYPDVSRRRRLWRKYARKPATPEAFARYPELIWEWYDWRRSVIARPSPTPTIALAESNAAPHFTLVTQNVGWLADRAGRRLLKVHGDIWSLPHGASEMADCGRRCRICPTVCLRKMGLTEWCGSAKRSKTWKQALAGRARRVFWSWGRRRWSIRRRLVQDCHGCQGRRNQRRGDAGFSPGGRSGARPRPRPSVAVIQFAHD